MANIEEVQVEVFRLLWSATQSA